MNMLAGMSGSNVQVLMEQLFSGMTTIDRHPSNCRSTSTIA